MSTYYFLPWVRSGMARLITTPDLGNDTLPDVSGRISLPVTITLKAKKTDGTISQQVVKPKDAATPPDEDPVQLYGPRDVVGIDVREIIRTGPLHLTPDYPPERFTFIEFDRPDFPWLFTPGAQSKDRLHPWLVLLVVEKSQATITPPTDNRLPVLSCPVTELPHRKEPPDKEPPDKVFTDLNESWAWAHGVYAGKVIDDNRPNRSKAEIIGALLQSDPQDRNLSRLLCPRKLKAHTQYEACLVPAFEVGRKAGLGMEFDPDQEPLAHWSFKEDKDVQLPVYYHWSFSTADKDQFIKLAQQLKPLSDDEAKIVHPGIAGKMDITNPENGIEPSNTSLTVSIPSALRISTDTTSSSTDDLPAGFDQKALKTLLTSFPEAKDKNPPLPPPVYGSWHAPPADLSTQLDTHLWLETLNLDPRYRVAAALGTSIIQKEQEHIIAAVWKEVGELQAVNEFLQRKEFARHVTDSIHKKRLTSLSPYAFLQVTEPVPLPVNDSLNSTKAGFRQLPHTQMKSARSRSRDAAAKAGTSAPSAQQTDEPLTSFAATVLADRPVAYYRFNETQGSPTVRDSSGHNHSGTVSAQGVMLGVSNAGQNDAAAEFEGLDDGRIVVPETQLLSPTRISIEALISWHGPNPYQQRIVEKSYSGASPSWPTYGLNVNPDGSVLFELTITTRNEPVGLTSRGKVTIGVPVHLVGAYDGSTMGLYIDGVLDNSTVVKGDVFMSFGQRSDIGIGNQVGRARPFKGLIDEVAIYDRALSADRIRAHAVAAFPLTPLEQVAIIPQFRRMTRAGRSWSIKGTISDYDPDRIAPPPGVREGDRSVSRNSLSKASPTVTKAARTDVSRLDSLKQDWLKRTDPQKIFAQEVAHRVKRPDQPRLKKAGSQEERFQQHGELAPFTYAPSFSNPMYEPLRDQFPEMLLPGLDKIPNDRATTLTVDAPFIEAYMVGLNHELSREFLWREFPTMLNVPYFRQFWDARGDDSQYPDIPKSIGDWENEKDGKPLDLGDHLASGRGAGLTFLLIRSELIVRYPNALIYARNGAELRLPSPRFSPITGVALVGFTIAKTEIKDWKFFVEEHFTEPYMGAPDATDGAYVSFPRALKTSAEIAGNILRERFYQEIKVVKEPDKPPMEPQP
ncbi:MAG: LamG domain-containing protein [Nitrospira sp.]|nr:LamG domain-containing protein [Nitrospira sp.]